MADRQVRFTEAFFEHLDAVLPSERGADGTPSVTDFLFLDLPTVRDDLAQGYEAHTLPTEDPDVRLYLGTGLLLRGYAIFTLLHDDAVEAFWITVDRYPRSGDAG